jgi:hypothetical protein
MHMLTSKETNRVAFKHAAVLACLALLVSSGLTVATAVTMGHVRCAERAAATGGHHVYKPLTGCVAVSAVVAR